MTMNKKYVTARDILIPAGTAVHVNPPHRSNWGVPSANVLTAVTKDSTSEWLMPLDEAIAAGLVAEVER